MNSKEVKIKLVAIDELPLVMEIIYDAKRLLSKDSLQWQQGYPNEETMSNDINSSYLYGYYINNYLVGIVSLVPGIDINYLEIEQGSWINYPSNKDLNIHRIAIRENYHKMKIGEKLLSFAIEFAKNNGFFSLKLDTHVKNIAMQRISLNTGFTYRGVIYLKRDEVDNSRLAYELSI
jgi:GNAT superfamily N-acetyltransferase